ncbi:MAG TPA: winged helix-turn-helix domain-containing protein [Terriglobales bacterium]|nr:winged helix-turn-helix domain-containing protein [Terriglobales bacterium]
MPVSVQLPQPRVCFRDFALDLTSGELHRNGHKLALPPKAFELLRALLEHPGEVVTREELRAKLWTADTFVEFDDSLNHAVKKLRRALGDSAENPQFIETLPRYGYRFMAPVETPGAPVMQPAPKGNRRAFTAGLSFAVALLAVLVALWLTRSQAPPVHSLAVLPFSNLTGDVQQDYFADGMTDALITDLAKVRGLKVISRTSVMRFRDTRRPLPEIARTLGVDSILEGSVQRSGQHVRITAQLIHAESDTHIWADSYERDFRDILTLQGEVAQAIVREIKVAVTPEENRSLTHNRPVNPEAYEAYLKGQAHWYRISREHMDSALEYFQLALDKDPNYALAWVGVANVWLLRGDAGVMLPTEAYPKAKTAVARSLALDSSLADAHIVNANIAGPYDRDWSTAEREYLRGIELNPNSADGHFMYSDYLISMKREAEWDREIHRTLELDPFNPFFQCFYGWQLVYLGRYDDAIVQLRKVLDTEPEFPSAHLGLWGAYFKKGMKTEALGEARNFFLALHDTEVEQALAREADRGYSVAMHRAADVLAARASHTYVPAVRIARLYAHAGDKDGVFRWLERAYVQHETTLTHLNVAWDWDWVRDDPHFQDLVQRMGLTLSAVAKAPG